MPVLFLVIGVVMLTSAVRGTVDTPNGLIPLLKSDFEGKNNFVYFIGAFLLIGGIGYIPQMKTLSRYVLSLVLIVIILKNGGVWSNLITALNGESSQTHNTQSKITQSSNTTQEATKVLPDLLA
jgi:hypothetical protein